MTEVLSDIYAGYDPIDSNAKNGAAFLVCNPDTGDFAKAYWHHDMWALYAGPDYDTVEQLSFEPTLYKRLGQ